MKKLEGSYKAKRDDQTYTYEVTCCAIGHTALWEAKILLGDELVGMPAGEVLTPGGVELTGAVRFEVESAIEHRLSVEYAEDALLGRSPRMRRLVRWLRRAVIPEGVLDLVLTRRPENKSVRSTKKRLLRTPRW